jgi:two-component system, NarL family, sensor kinase
MKKFSIFKKLFLSIFVVSSGGLMALGIVVYFSQKSALFERTSNQLQSVNMLKKTMVEKRLLEDEKFVWHFVRKVMLFDTLGHFSPDLEFRRHKDFLKDFCEDYGHIDVLLLDQNETLVDSLFEDHKPRYNNDTSSFYFTRIFNVHNSKYKLALVTSTKYYEGILFENTGMGSTGESYLVSDNHVLITKSRFFPEIAPGRIIVKSSSTEFALVGKTGVGLTKDYRDIDVLSAYTPIQHKSLHWVLLSEIDLSEAMYPVLEMRSFLVYFTLLVILAAIAVAFYLSKIIAKPIKDVSASLQVVAHGDVPSKIPPPFYNNEVGAMQVAMNQLIDSYQLITAFSIEIGKGNLSANFQLLGDKDRLGQSLLRMRNQLKNYQEQEKNLRRQKTLSLLEGQEEERKRIARDLHDGLGQWLTGLKFKIASVSMPEDQREELKALVSETIDETRRITNNLMPTVLVDFGLDAALRQMVGNIKKGSDLHIEYDYKKERESNMPFEVMVTLYRIAQESLNNIMKHAKASNVLVQVVETEEHISLQVEDDGVGMPKGKFGGGHGLGNMAERAQLINGKFLLENKEKGTRLRVDVPLL